MDNSTKEKKILCPYEKKCGGCSYLSEDYKSQLKKKKNYVSDLLKDYVRVDSITGMDNPYHYRNKVTCSFGMDNKKHPVAGIYAEKSHIIVPVKNCYIEDEKATAIMETVKELFKSFKLRYFDENTGFGLIRHVQIRTAHETGEIMVTIVTASPVFPSKQNFCKALRDKHPEITTIIQNVNNRTDSLVLSDKENVLYGKGFIEDRLCGKTFKISSKSFYQINSIQTEILYRKAVDFAGLTGKEVVLDTYCGIGTIGIIASDKAKQVIGVELNKDAVRDAVTNAKRNNVQNITFYTDDAGKFMEKASAGKNKVDVVFMDPPRNGSSEVFIKSLVKLSPRRIVYISCGPESLARDLKMLTKDGYRAEKAECVDMFPMTNRNHVETVCLLSKENFNMPKSENSRQPKCPKEKEDAIMEALKAFQMI